ncbi:hypothetical protein [Kamptonema formosum]|uniref:hypothetical protein n=1 Tax=Kamptonema formosum TaxID=331992 RepID=UPI00034C4C98|nr:hypothetical protein [Oscillatoria sp. PCC 10802]
MLPLSSAGEALEALEAGVDSTQFTGIQQLAPSVAVFPFWRGRFVQSSGAQPKVNRSHPSPV